MKSLLQLTLLLLSIGLMTSCAGKQEQAADDTINFIAQQYGLMIEKIEGSPTIVNPKSIIDGKMKYIPPQEWTSDSSGSLWYIYELTGEEAWIPYAVKYTEALDTIQYYTGNHDVGFMITVAMGTASV